jgi:CRISPR/Cas system-associated exonuclease Cas4 (RecB family)
LKENSDLRVIRASEIGEYVFCHRAWWLHHIQGVESANRERMSAGVVHHQAHGHAVIRSSALQRAALAFFAFAVFVAILFALSLR